MDERKRLYIAHINERATSESGIGIFTTWGHLTECGRYVEQNHAYRPDKPPQIVLNPIDDYWRETPAAAMAAKAAKIRAIGERLIRQADELEEAARQEVTS